MAELLIKAWSATHPDATKDRRGCYKRGDIVVVKPDGFEWGAAETLPDFVLVKIPGVTVDKVQALTGMQTEDDAGTPLTDENGAPITYRRRRWRVLVDNIPPAILNELKTTGEVTVTPAQIRAYVTRIRDSLQYPDL